MEPKKTRNTTIYLPDKLKARAYAYMIRTGRTQGATGRGLSDLVAEALTAFLSAQNKKPKNNVGNDRK